MAQLLAIKQQRRKPSTTDIMQVNSQNA